MEIDDNTDWMTEDDDDDWLMQDSPLHDLPPDQSSTPTVMPASPFSPRNIWEIVSSFTPLKQITLFKKQRPNIRN